MQNYLWKKTLGCFLKIIFSVQLAENNAGHINVTTLSLHWSDGSTCTATGAVVLLSGKHSGHYQLIGQSRVRALPLGIAVCHKN